MDEFRIEKRHAKAALTLSNGRSVRGRFFLSASAANHAGPERIDDVLNTTARFFPFELEGVSEASPRVVLYSPAHIVFVQVQDPEFDLRADPSYEVAPRESALFLLSHGEHVSGSMHILSPKPAARLSDFTKLTEPFHYVETNDRTLLLNFAHVIEISPLKSPPKS